MSDHHLNKWLEFKELADFKAWIAKAGTKFPFRNGKFNAHEFSFDQSGNFFLHFVPDSPPKTTTAQSVLGLHTHRNIILSAEFLYQAPTHFHRQGDVMAAEQPAFEGLNSHIDVRPSHWVILSQTCVVARKQQYCSLVPAYRSSFLTGQDILITLGMNPNHLKKDAGDNVVQRILALPPDDRLGIDDDRLYIDLSQVYPIGSEKLKEAVIGISLTFPGNAYFASRLAMWQFRDVEGWDDAREPK
ncbi:MAG TPA: hypothetical protein VE954_31480 [Oligoflexus sp.]|uniref:hypothetical protein n=1 Tax=Oligoflexus sp. TaxID=1971216 RepID=UPI002D7645A8|nr:hypothetical protein [Oligoflexus sp.]HYX37647.1 hypothetical protein [Oligoflexus sp.]